MVGNYDSGVVPDYKLAYTVTLELYFTIVEHS